jgi:site-specific DNA-methyltransferase (cytosine-N4-specific)
MEKALHKTNLGTYYIGDSNELLRSDLGDSLRGKVQLLLTSPPFPLNNKKSYGNLKREIYKSWFVGLAKVFADLLTEDG